MPLSEVQIPSEEIECLGTTICLRPLTLQEATQLAGRHAPILMEAWALYGAQIQSSDEAVLLGGAYAFIAHTTDAVADLIATCAGEPERVDVARSLPVDVQFRAAFTIFRLTCGQADPASILKDFRGAMLEGGRLRETAH